MSRKKTNFIDGIFNYCDRWCERCPFTSRCRSFAMEKKIRAKMEEQDRENQKFWDAMNAALGDAMGEISKMAKELEPEQDEEVGTPFDDVEEDEFDLGHRRVQRHQLATLSWRYSEHARRSLASNFKDPEELDDTAQVISWYHLFIHVKLCRALSSRLHEVEISEEDAGDEWMDEEPYPKDSDGSAKIAIIGMERSISAWTIVAERQPDFAEEARRIIKMLIKLRGYSDREFPEARGFHRPGFDDVEENRSGG